MDTTHLPGLSDDSTVILAVRPPAATRGEPFNTMTSVRRQIAHRASVAHWLSKLAKRIGTT